MYFDLNIPYDPDLIHDLKEILSTLVKLGYDGVALNHIVTGRLSPSDANVIQPIEFSEKDEATPNAASSFARIRLDAAGRSFKQYKRITIHLEDPSQVHVLNPNNPVLMNYDIVAVVPKTEAMLLKCCQSTEIDIISLDLTKRIPFPLKQAVLSQAMDHGIYFEVTMSGLLDANARKHILTNMTHLMTVTKGRNILFTSGAQNVLQLRNPYDLANLAALFGMEAATAKKGLSSYPRSVILHGETRTKTHKGALKVTSINELPAESAWMIPGNPLDVPMETPVQDLMEVDTSTAKKAEETTTEQTRGKKRKK